MSAEHSTETWKVIADFPCYEVSNLGRVRSWRNGRWGKSIRPHVLKATVASHGYPTVNLSNPGTRQKTFSVHVLVLEAFVGRCPAGLESLHGPAGKRNASLANLSWGTPSQNQGPDRLRDGCHNRGERNGFHRLTRREVLEIIEMLENGAIQAAVAEKFEVNPGTVSAIWVGVSWAWLTGRGPRGFA